MVCCSFRSDFIALHCVRCVAAFFIGNCETVRGLLPATSVNSACDSSPYLAKTYIRSLPESLILSKLFRSATVATTDKLYKTSCVVI